MAQITWVFDAPTGVYKSRELSEKIYEAAIQETVFMDHVKPIPSFGKKKGETVTLTRMQQLSEPSSARLSETERIPEDTYALSTTSITVDDWGRAVPFTSLSDDLTFFNLENQVQKALKTQMKLIMDTAAATAFKTLKVKYVPTGASSATVTTNGTAGAQASANMNLYHVEEIHDYLYDTLRVPTIGDDYIGIFRQLALRGLMRDSNWAEWHKYTDPSAKYNGEVGRIEGTRFIATNHSEALGKIGASSVLGEGVVFGDDCVAMAEALTPELRAKMPDDYGRSKGVAWYGIFEFGLIWDTGNAGEAKGIHVTST